MDYFQPDFYRFNQDSIQLIETISRKVESSFKTLDIGAGCGVIGIELARKIKIREMVLLEPQEDFQIYLQKNIERFIPEAIISIVQESIGVFQSSDFDLIVCNPPYYLPGHGVSSKDYRRNMARSFILDNWEVLLIKINSLLSNEGVAFILVPSLKIVMEMVDRISEELFSEINKYESESFFIYELKL